MNSHLVRPALFTSTADASALRDRAQLLPYDRDSLAPGEVLPIRDEPFLRALLAARSIYFDGRETHLGDTLLGLSHLEAVRDAAWLLGLRLTETASPEIAHLLEVPATTRPPDHAMRISVGPVRTGQLMPRADLPAFRTSTRVYADLPSRRYLDVERRLGLRLPKNRFFLPTLSGRPAAGRGRPLICYIAASSWPEKKDYGVRGFALVAQRINAITGCDFDHALIQGLEDPQETHPPLLALPLESHDITALLGLFTQATLIIGNDTGLIHAAAMTKSHTRLGVIGIYGRHSYLRFTTGDRRQYAIATPFAQAMALSDRSPARDGIDDEWYPYAAAVRRIAPEYIAECALRVLEGDF
jgi:hypothetical protein